MPKPLPKESIADGVHLVARAALSSIPFVGGAALEFFNRFLAAPIQRRRDVWLNDLSEGVARLQKERRVKVEDLQKSEAFVSTVMHASQVAVQNHQREKLTALRNVVLNTALNTHGGFSFEARQ